MKRNDEARLKERLPNVKPARLALEKSKLYSEICANIAQLNHRQTEHTNLLMGVAECDVLMEKGLKDEALERCEKLAKVAFAQGELTLELMLRERMRLVLKDFDRLEYGAQIDFNHNRLTTLSDQQTNLNQLRIARDEALDLVHRYQKLDDQKMKRGFDRIFSRPVLANVRNAQSFEAQLCFHSAWRFYHEGLKEEPAAYEHGLEMIKLWEINPERMKLKPNVYIQAVMNVCGALIRMNRFDEVTPLLEKVEALELTEPRHKAVQFISVQVKRQLLSLNRADIEAAIANEGHLMAGLKRFGAYVPHRITFLLLSNQALAHMLNDDYGKSIALHTRIIALKRQETRSYLQSASIIIRLLLLAWTDDGSSISHYLRSFGKQFAGAKGPDPLRETVLQYVSQYWKSENEQERKDLTEGFAEALSALNDRKVAGAEELWLVARSRVTGIPAKQLFRESVGIRA